MCLDQMLWPWKHAERQKKNNLLKSSELILKLVHFAIENSEHKYACDIHVLLFLDNTYGAILFDYFNVKFSVPINILNKHGLEHITFLTNNGLGANYLVFVKT